MAPDLILPQSTRGTIGQIRIEHRHPGLQLDKFSPLHDKTGWQGEKLADVVRARGDNDTLQSALKRRSACLAALNASAFTAKSSAPLTLHLSRSSALENAGICLHPIYGFVYLPGSGLKGMARAYAETIWLESQEDKKLAWRHIEDVFGWASNPDRKKLLDDDVIDRRREIEGDPNSPEIKACTGSVIFHDAWPLSWPELFVDIVNSHHSNYYQGGEPDGPGDWEDPIPVNFLAVKPTTDFSFALSLRPGAVAREPSKTPDEQLALAKLWLLGALLHLGAGAKTNAGYGYFNPGENCPQEAVQAIDAEYKAVCACFETPLTLVSPAFLAGASQEKDDCDLRPATLRGLLRWWWRTLHAGFVDVPTLRAMEAAVWGDTSTGGAVRIMVGKANTPNQPILFPFKQIGRNKKGKEVLKFDEKATKKYNLKPPGRQTQPLFYATFGMDEMDAGKPASRKQRYCMEPGASWKITIAARACSYKEYKIINGKKEVVYEKGISRDLAIDQARAALWLLCHFGGVGAKSRNGFGSLEVPENLSGLNVDWCLGQGKALREVCQRGEAQINEHWAESSSLKFAMDFLKSQNEKEFGLELETSCKNAWEAMENVGNGMQEFAQKRIDSSASVQHGKHGLDKVSLGLPRQIHGPGKENYQNKRIWQPPVPLTASKGNDTITRYTSPVQYHLVKSSNGKFVIRVLAFPAKHLPDFDRSKKVFEELFKHLKEMFSGPSGVESQKTTISAAQVAMANAPPADAMPGPQLASLLQRVEITDPQNDKDISFIIDDLEKLEVPEDRDNVARALMDKLVTAKRWKKHKRQIDIRFHLL